MNDDGIRRAAASGSAGTKPSPCTSGERRKWLRHFSAALAWGAAGLASTASAQGSAASAGKTILVVGDSLSAEYGLTRGRGWVALMQQRLARMKIDARVVNASISGDTTSGGRSRLAPLLAQYKPTLVVVELGANDALRGLPLVGTRANLVAMVEASKAAGARVVIVGMQVPPNYGRQYSDQFAGLFASVAKAEGASLVPFMLKGVADVPDFANRFQADGIHPTESQHPIILDNIWPSLEPLLR